LIGSGGLGLGWLAGMDWQAILAGGAVTVVVIIILILLRRQIIAAVKDVRQAVEQG
jgi:ABC-type glycerol-3-phosphate transport system permease component